VFQGVGFSILAVFGNSGDFGNFLWPSACVPRYIAHPGVELLLQTKAQVPFDRTVTERSKVPFYAFQPPNLAQFQLRFSHF
jgi:hypothetical protein